MIKDKKILLSLPSLPGIYFFKDSNGKVLYIGKAVNLKNRIRNYFSGRVSERIAEMIRKASSLGFEITETEIESLLLEAKLIKAYQPKYNVSLKDSSRYLYVGITKEKYPRVVFLRQPELENNLKAWYGPFPSSGGLKQIMRLVRRIFPYRTCQTSPKKYCLFRHLKLCQCHLPPEIYRETIRDLRLFLEGKIERLIEDLNERMKEAASELNFEEAQKYKHQIEMVKELLLSYQSSPSDEKIARQLADLRRLLVNYQKIDPVFIHRLEGYDVSSLGEALTVGSMVVFINGEPDPRQYRQFRLHISMNDPAAIGEILSRRFRHQDWLYPQVILIDGGKNQITAAFSVMKSFGLIGHCAVLGLAKKKETIVLPVIQKDEILFWKMIDYPKSSVLLQLLQFVRDEAHRFSQRYYKSLYRRLNFSLPRQKKN